MNLYIDFILMIMLGDDTVDVVSDIAVTRRGALSWTLGGTIAATILPATATSQQNTSQSWTFEKEGNTRASAQVKNNSAFVGIGNQLYSVNITDGEQQWVYDAEEITFRALPKVGEEIVVVAGTDNLHAVDINSGELQWQFTPDRPVSEKRPRIRESLALADGMVFVGSRGGKFYALDADNGTEIWQFDVPSSLGVVDPPAVADETVIFAGRSSRYIVTSILLADH
jgi:outer membrane protein assembly factor BamB